MAGPRRSKAPGNHPLVRRAGPHPPAPSRLPRLAPGPRRGLGASRRPSRRPPTTTPSRDARSWAGSATSASSCDDQSGRSPPRTDWVLLSALLAASLTACPRRCDRRAKSGEGAQTQTRRVTAGTPPKSVWRRSGGGQHRPDQPGDSEGLDRRIALTFDDGPTPWTADILDVLREHGVPATFFVVGARAADRPDLVERM